MNELIKEFKMPWLTAKQKVYVWYFVLSLMSLCVSDDTPLWLLAVIVLNFANAARLVRKVPMPETD